MSDNIEFLEKLYDILENPLYSKIIDWNGDHIFEIKNLERFNSIILPRFYENENYDTFVSQLYSFHFKRIQDTLTSQSFSHPHFRKSNRSMLQKIIENGNQPDNEITPRKQGAAFLEKLFDILEDSTYEDCICWCDDGKSVLVKKVEEFSQVVLPKFYKHNNFQSFVRQLNMYNFSKTSHDANWREFKQPLFRKGKRSLLSLITRKTQQKNQQERVAIDPILEKIPVSQSKHEKIGRTSKLSIDPTNGNLTNGDLIALIFELQNKLSHMESRIYFLEKHLLECPNYVGDHGQDDYTISVSPSLSIQSLTSPSAAFTMPNQSFRDPQSLSLPSTRQNSENGSMCSELGSLISTRSRSSTFTDKYPHDGKKEKALHSFDGAYVSSIPTTNRMEGVALQRRNRSTSIGYDTFEVASQSDTASGVDAILTAAAAVAQSISTSPTDNLAMMNGRPLKKMKTISDDPVATTNMEEGMPIQRKVSLSTPFEGLVVSKMSSIG